MVHSVLHQKRLGTIQVQDYKSDLMLTDPNTKPIGDPTLQRKIDRVIGTQYYPSEGSEHHKILFYVPEVSITNISSSKKATPTKYL
eukprot:3786379-Ditylum_brightwellii.AAC.1